MPDDKPAAAAPPAKAAPKKSDDDDLIMNPSKYSGMKLDEAKKQMAIDAKGEKTDPDADLSRKMDPADDRPAK